MREIKFRVWNIKTKNWLKDEGLQFLMINYAKVLDPLNHLFDPYHQVAYQQFTGLKDKNGKDIYERDIVLLDSPQKMYEIYFDEGGFMGKNHKFGDTFEIKTHINKFNNRLRVIGNIYEHPELLK